MFFMATLDSETSTSLRRVEEAVCYFFVVWITFPCANFVSKHNECYNTKSLVKHLTGVITVTNLWRSEHEIIKLCANNCL